MELLSHSPSVSRPTSEPSTPIKRGYEADPDYEPEAGEAREVEEGYMTSFVSDEERPPPPK